jgi:hypothetical protein
VNNFKFFWYLIMYETILKGLISAGILLAVSSSANAALDFTDLQAAVDADTIVSAIAAIAAIKILPGVARWGFSKVITWFGNDDLDPYGNSYSVYGDKADEMREWDRKIASGDYER